MQRISLLAYPRIGICKNSITKLRLGTIRIGFANHSFADFPQQRLALLLMRGNATRGLATVQYSPAGRLAGDDLRLRGVLWAITVDHLGIGDVIESGDDQKDRDDSGEKERTRHF